MTEEKAHLIVADFITLGVCHTVELRKAVEVIARVLDAERKAHAQTHEVWATQSKAWSARVQELEKFFDLTVELFETPAFQAWSKLIKQVHDK